MKNEVTLDRVSVANLTAGRVDPVEFIESAASGGFGAVGLLLMSATAHPLQHEVVGRPEVVRKVKSALKSHNMRIFDVEAFILSPASDFEKFRPALEVGAELGATHISSIGTEVIGNSAYLEPTQRIDLFGRLCDEAARFGLHVGVEFMLYRDIATWKDALDLVEAAGRSNAGLIIDTLHLYRAGGTPQDVAGISANRIAYAQLSDAIQISPELKDLPTEARGSRLHLGTGSMPLHELVDALPKATQLVIETPIAAEANWSTIRRIQSVAGSSRRFFERHAAR
ncbi:sugar phosphate isomerase/epimerase [Bradyrhizobium canariense]|uniref:sugar phosphate isomerase/epimerase family protein n=1 Tax=Bradyrhizobium canariense TaxID=255045 RepID=UPI001C663523|nr:sugar phosphate isomerase/epimerase [Bradyrhizobium canariense]MBW5433695.1 sugar phosphate isomerase/epimerase [Bradyrhizobium canariense]